MTNNHAYTNYNKSKELSPWALLYIEQDPNYTSVNINIVCMVVVTLLMVHSSTLGHISAVFIAHDRDQGKLYQLCILLLAVWATKCAQSKGVLEFIATHKNIMVHCNCIP